MFGSVTNKILLQQVTKRMFLIGLFFFYLISDSVMCWNSTAKYMSVDEDHIQSRKSRIFSFNTHDEDVTIELNFAVPFIKIPIKKSMDMAKGAVANISLEALLLSGVLTFGATVILPALVSILTTKIISPHSSLRSTSYSPYRTAESSDVWRYLTILDNALTDINIDATSCMQRTLCSTVRHSSKNVNSGNGSSMDKIIDGLASSELLQKFFSHTPIYSAMRNGQDNLDCGREYEKCTLSKSTLNMIFKKFLNVIHGEN